MLTPRHLRDGTRFTCGAPENCGSRVRNVGYGVRNVSVSVAARLDPSLQLHSAFRIGVPHQRYSYVTDYLQGSRAHLVDRVLGRVPVRIIEVHHVDRVDPGFLERHVVVRQAVPDAGYEGA